MTTTIPNQFTEYISKNIKTQTDAIKFLQDVGIFDETGKLSYIYRSDINTLGNNEKTVDT